MVVWRIIELFTFSISIVYDRELNDWIRTWAGVVGLVDDGLRMFDNEKVIYVFDDILEMLLVSFRDVVLLWVNGIG